MILKRDIVDRFLPNLRLEQGLLSNHSVGSKTISSAGIVGKFYSVE